MKKLFTVRKVLTFLLLLVVAGNLLLQGGNLCLILLLLGEKVTKTKFERCRISLTLSACRRASEAFHRAGMALLERNIGRQNIR